MIPSERRLIAVGVPALEGINSINYRDDRLLTICGIQQTTNDIDSTAINLANALSSAVVTISGVGPVTVNNGFALDDDLVTRRSTPALQFSLLSALETARLHQTIDRQRPVPVHEEITKIRHSLKMDVAD